MVTFNAQRNSCILGIKHMVTQILCLIFVIWLKYCDRKCLPSRPIASGIACVEREGGGAKEQACNLPLAQGLDSNFLTNK